MKRKRSSSDDSQTTKKRRKRRRIDPLPPRVRRIFRDCTDDVYLMSMVRFVKDVPIPFHIRGETKHFRLTEVCLTRREVCLITKHVLGKEAYPSTDAYLAVCGAIGHSIQNINEDLLRCALGLVGEVERSELAASLTDMTVDSGMQKRLRRKARSAMKTYRRVKGRDHVHCVNAMRQWLDMEKGEWYDIEPLVEALRSHDLLTPPPDVRQSGHALACSVKQIGVSSVDSGTVRLMHALPRSSTSSTGESSRRRRRPAPG